MNTLFKKNKYPPDRKKLRDYPEYVFKNKKEIIRYLFFGGCTTLVNIITYYIWTRGFHITVLSSTIAAWILSMLFAYITNRRYVFQSKNSDIKAVFLELITFVICRLFTGALDICIMYVFVHLLRQNDFMIKILSNFVVISGNYVVSRLLIFRKKD
jgi:putative flippase GtrA